MESSIVDEAKKLLVDVESIQALPLLEAMGFSYFDALEAIGKANYELTGMTPDVNSVVWQVYSEIGRNSLEEIRAQLEFCNPTDDEYEIACHAARLMREGKAQTSTHALMILREKNI